MYAPEEEVWMCADGIGGQLTPFVTRVLKERKGSWNDGRIDGRLTGKEYMKLWKEEARAGWAE